jgi:acyl-CoA synthetase (AMP-forming)/AMP-acid ligase II/aryl carrier-like protein
MHQESAGQAETLPGLAQGSTLVDILRWRAVYQAARTAAIFLAQGEIEEERITYAQLHQRTQALAARLRARLTTGERVLLLYPSSIDYIVAFLACLYAGIIAVPAYPPSSPRSMGRIQAIVADAGISVVLTTSQLLAKLQQWSERIPELQSMHWLTSDESRQEQAGHWEAYRPSLENLAFLQYTSGTTGSPKGVMVSHANLMHNFGMIEQRADLSVQSVGVSWLPMFHDMGLILGVLQALYTGYPAILMAPASFIQRPLRWLQAITRYRGTISFAPNFAYDLCLERISPEDRAELDLSSWAMAVNAAETVHAETVRRFTETFAFCGLRPTALAPSYGMAETTLMISNCPLERVATLLSFDRASFEKNRVRLSDDPYTSQPLVGCGSIGATYQLEIVNPTTLRQAREGEIGEIWLAGPSVAQGYWGLPGETQQTFAAYLEDTHAGPFLRTGDLGFVRADELFITGRLKDMLIIRGRNYYPQDLELTAEASHPSLRPGCGAAFSIEVDNEERLVIVHEVARHHADPDEIIAAIRQAIPEYHEIPVYAVALIRFGSIFKTSSGKIQRKRCREAFLQDDFPLIARYLAPEIAEQDDLADKALQEVFLQRLQAASPEEQEELLLALINQQVRSLVGHEGEEAFAPTQNLLALGLDSLTGTQLMNRLQRYLGRALPDALTFVLEDPTIEKLARYLLSELSRETTSSQVTEAALNEWLGAMP